MKNSTLPSFYGILEIQHYIKGRIRVKIESLKNDDKNRVGIAILDHYGELYFRNGSL